MNNDKNNFYEGKEPVDETSKVFKRMTSYYILVRTQLLTDGGMDEDYVDEVAMELYKHIVALGMEANKGKEGTDG